MGLGLKKTYAEIRAVPAIALDRVMAARLPPTDVYVVNGFWRSGTTWLQQNLARAIGAKTIFEPFEQRFVDYRERAHAFHPFRVGLYEGAFLPYLDRPENMEKVRPFLDTIFRGYAGLSFGLKARDSWRDSFRRKLVVKFVRASLSLEGIHSTYSCPVIHIRRHPCGVVASYRAIRDEWGRSFDELRIKKLLFEPTDGHADLFGEYRDVISRCDEAGTNCRLAAYWALSERYVEAKLANAHWALKVDYEDLVAAPESAYTMIFDFLGCKVGELPDFKAASAVTGRKVVSADQRSSDWATRLSTKEIDAIMAVVDELFPNFDGA